MFMLEIFSFENSYQLSAVSLQSMTFVLSEGPVALGEGLLTEPLSTSARKPSVNGYCHPLG